MDATITYSDLILVVLATTLVAGALVGYVTPLPYEASIPLFGVLGVVAIGHAIFASGRVESPADLSEEVPVEEVPEVLGPFGDD